MKLFKLFILVIPLLTGCGGGALAEFFGDGGARVVVTGPIMGATREVCLNNPPTNYTPGDLQKLIDQYIFKAVRWDSGATISKKIEADRSCSLNLNPYLTMEWSVFVDTGANTQLADWGSMNAILSAGKKTVNVCVWDNECEDGDILDITLDGRNIARRELFNQQTCLAVEVKSGVNYLGVYAVNGTGFKGNCSFGDRNTGVVSVQGGNTGANVQTYSVKGGQGSYGSLTILN